MKNEDKFFNNSIYDEQAAAFSEKQLTDPMQYQEGMEIIDSDIFDKVQTARAAYDYTKYTEADVRAALAHSERTPEDFAALLSPAALPLLEEIARAAQIERQRYFGNNVTFFTPLYIANYCENYCIYCGFNSHNKIQRACLSSEQIAAEMQAIAATGQQEILILTGESRKMSDVHYIGEACKQARQYFKVVGVEIYPLNSDEYAYLHECGVDYVTVFQETYNKDKYAQLHLAGHKRVFPYRFTHRSAPCAAKCAALASPLCSVSTTSVATLSLPACMPTCCKRNIRMRKSPSPAPACVPSSTTTKLNRWTCTSASCCRLSAPTACSCPSPQLPFPAANARACVIT